MRLYKSGAKPCNAPVGIALRTAMVSPSNRTGSRRGVISNRSSAAFISVRHATKGGNRTQRDQNNVKETTVVEFYLPAGEVAWFDSFQVTHGESVARTINTFLTIRGGSANAPEITETPSAISTILVSD